MPKVIHLVPYDAIGGVESAARSMPGGVYSDISFHKYYLVRKKTEIETEFEQHGPSMSENDPRPYIRAIRDILRSNPDLVIASLWRSCIILIILKLLRPRFKTVTFLHLASDVHWPDKVLNLVAMRLSSEIWADSATTLNARVPSKLKSRGRIISFVIRSSPRSLLRAGSPEFMFWGRLHGQKEISRAIKLFFEVYKQHPDAKFRIIGPDGGKLEQLMEQVEQLGLGDTVEFLGPMEQEQVFEVARESSFYLQTSTQEGMAMSVVEAMQLGLVPVVTPVGEIASYCRDGENAVLIQTDSVAVKRVVDLINDADLYLKYSHSAVATWESRPLYRDDVLAGCRDLVGKDSKCAA